MLAAEPAQRGLVVGHHVGTPQLVQLDAVLERAEEGVGVVQRLAVLAPDVAAARSARRARSASSGSRSDSSARPCTSWSSWTANSTSRSPPDAELELALGLAGPGCGRRPGDASPARRSTKPSRSAADQTIGSTISTSSRPSARSPGDRAGLEQRLELPGLGPALVVAAVAGERADQRPGLALGAQVASTGQIVPSRGVVGADLHQVAASWVAARSGHRLVGAPSGRARSTKMTSTSET